MYASRIKSIMLLSALCLAIVAPAANAQSNSASFKVGLTVMPANDPLPADDGTVRGTKHQAGRTVDPELDLTFDYDTFNYAVVNGRKSAEGYPIYAMECDFQSSKQCVGEAGQVLGSITDVAAEMTTVSNKDVLRDDWYCDRICVNSQNVIVGAVTPEMQAWLKRNPSFKRRATAKR